VSLARTGKSKIMPRNLVFGQLQNHVVDEPAEPAAQSHVVVPYVHSLPGAVSHIEPAVGSALGQGAVQSHLSPPPPAGPAKLSQVHSAAP
jgi:hypothetical protein